MRSLELSQDDLIQHIVKFGLDIYPAVEIPKERTRLNMFYEEARRQYPHLCDQLIASDTDFRISKQFQSLHDASGPRFRVETFVLTNRGPVFTFPLLLPDPVGSTNLEAKMVEQFKAVRTLFFSALAERKVMRIGLVRDLLFNVGRDACEYVLSDRQVFAGAQLKGGKSRLLYQDDLCNVGLEVEPAEVMRTTRLPVGAQVTERLSYGLHVVLDVNNRQPKPLEDADIDLVLERASSFWPDEMLKYFRAEE